ASNERGHGLIEQPQERNQTNQQDRRADEIVANEQLLALHLPQFEPAFLLTRLNLQAPGFAALIAADNRWVAWLGGWRCRGSGRGRRCGFCRSLRLFPDALVRSRRGAL